MLLKFIVAVTLVCPLIGVWLMERGATGGSINREGFANGASCAFLLYVGLVVLSMKIASRRIFFRDVGLTDTIALRDPREINGRVILLMMLMLVYVLFGVGGIENYRLTTNAGEFRASLGPASGLFGGIILKYIAPSMFAFALMTNVAWSRRRIRSLAVLSLAAIMALIGGAYGYKSSFVLAVLPAAILYYWCSSALVLLPLGIIATCLILFGYYYFASISDIAVAFDMMLDRLFVLQGDVAWLVWELHQTDAPLPNYFNTLPAIAGDRIASFLTGITRDDEYDWVMSHFSLMVTHLSGYPVETILGGHNNTVTVFSEGMLAGGLFGVVLFAMLSGLIISLIYNFIHNKLRANDFAWAAVGASYFVNGVMAWLIAGGVQVVIHISIPVLLYGTYWILRAVSGRPAKLTIRAQSTASLGS